MIGDIKFPESILPKASYVHVINFTALLSSQDVYIIRRSDRSSEETFNELGLLKVDLLKPRNIPFLSLNLLGGEFKPEHNCFRMLDRGAEKWPGDVDVSLEDYQGCYDVMESYCNIYLYANNMDGQVVTYNQHKTRELTKAVEEFYKHMEGDKPKPVNDIYKFEGEVKLVHDPTNLNYWHLEYNLFDFSGVAIKNAKSTYAEKYCETVITDIICANSSKTIQGLRDIPEEFYIKPN